MSVWPVTGAADIRIAVFAAPFSRDGPGLLLRDIIRGGDEGIDAASDIIATTDPDILVLTDFDYDAGGAALGALASVLADIGTVYPYRFALAPNSGQPSGLDLDGDGRTGGPADNLGFGFFAGDGGMAILSKLPILTDAVVDLSGILWADVPGATLPQSGGASFLSAEALAVLPLSDTGHWIVPVEVAGRGRLDLMIYDAAPPVFDGPEDMNGLRNRDETRLWQLVLDGAFGPAPQTFVIAGNTNLDPFDGDGLRQTMVAFLADPRLQDPEPASLGGADAADPDQRGDPALDTADWPDGAPGNLRVSYVLPSANLPVTGAGVFWPPQDDPAAALLGPNGQAAGAHRLVWVDISW